MELLEIIIYSLKLFSLSAFILITLSYFFFKVKDRTRIKPYMLISTDPAAYMPPEEKPVSIEKNVDEEINYNDETPANEEMPYVLNEELGENDVVIEFKPNPVNFIRKNQKLSSKFKVVNEENIAKQNQKRNQRTIYKPKTQVQSAPQQGQYQGWSVYNKAKVQPAIVGAPANIYNLYASVPTEPMHKLKLSVAGR